MHLCVSSSLERQRQVLDITRDSSYRMTDITPDKLSTQAAGEFLGQIIFSTIHQRPSTQPFIALGRVSWQINNLSVPFSFV